MGEFVFFLKVFPQLDQHPWVFVGHPWLDLHKKVIRFHTLVGQMWRSWRRRMIGLMGLLKV